MEANREDIPKGFLWQLISVIAFIALSTVIACGEDVSRLFRGFRRKLGGLQSHN